MIKIAAQNIAGTETLSDDDATKLEAKMNKLINFLSTETISSNKKMMRFFQFIDDAMTAFRVEEKSVCKKGCSYCCHVDVGITIIEAQYIALNTGHKYTPVKKRQHKGYHKTKTPCPFLVDDNCSIYEFRPLACRMFYSLDSVDFCKDESYPQHKIFQVESWGTAVNLYAEIYKSYKSGEFHHGDIREFFNQQEQ